MGTLTDLQKDYRNLVSGAVLPGYYCLLKSGDQVQAVKYYDCADDCEAILKATSLLDSKPAHLSAEIRQGDRLVARIPRRDRHRTTLR